MHLDFAEVKKHPYAIGGVVIVGGLILYLLLSSSQSSGSSAAAASSQNNQSQVLAADLQMQQLQAGVSTQNYAQQVALQTAQLQAQTTQQQNADALQASDVSNLASLASALYGTQASVAVNAQNQSAATTQQENQLVYAQNMQQMDDSVLTSQINAAQNEQANADATTLAGDDITANYQLGVAQLQTQANAVNDVTALAGQNLSAQTTLATTNSNNAAALAALNSSNSYNLAGEESDNDTSLDEYQIGAGVANNSINSQTQLASTELGDAYNLSSTQQNAVLSVLPTIVSQAGSQKNSALDATDQTGIFNTILSGLFSPSVAAASTSASASTAAAGDNATTSQIGTITNGITSITKSLGSAFFG